MSGGRSQIGKRGTIVDRKINWAIQGCAGIAEKAFIPAVRESRNGVLAGIAAEDENKAKAWAGRFGFRRSYRDYQELVEIPNNIHQGGTVS